MTRQNGFWKSGFRLVRNRQYNNERAERKWQPPDSRKVTWCWGIAMASLDTFYDTYGDQSHEVLQPCRDARVWAVRWDELDAYICGRSDLPPMFEEFDSSLHLVVKTSRLARDIFGCVRDGNYYSYFETPFAVCVEGRIRSRHRKHPRW